MLKRMDISHFSDDLEMNPFYSIDDKHMEVDCDEQEQVLMHPHINITIKPRTKKTRTYILADAVFEVENRYVIKEVIGKGSYGVVASAMDLKEKKMVAIKKIENLFERRSLAKRTLRELKLLRCFKHDNVSGVTRIMRPTSRNFNSIYLVSDLMETDLGSVISSGQQLSEEHIRFFVYQILRGLKYIHSVNVMHRDMKPRNLLVNSNCDLKICDFGLARLDDLEFNNHNVMSDYIATRWYRAPEVILSNSRYTKAVDIWAVGCILAELYLRKPVFPGRDSLHQLTLIIATLGTPTETTSCPPKMKAFLATLPKRTKVPFNVVIPQASPQAHDLLDKLLSMCPEKRITVNDALQHPYFADLRDENDEPDCTTVNTTDFLFEFLRPSTDDLRVLIEHEIIINYPPAEDEEWEMEDDLPLRTEPYPFKRHSRRKSN